MLRKGGKKASSEISEAVVIIQAGDVTGRDQDANAVLHPAIRPAFPQITSSQVSANTNFVNFNCYKTFRPEECIVIHFSNPGFRKQKANQPGI